EEYDRFKDREPDVAPPDSDATALVLNRPQLEAARAALGRARATLADARLRLSRSTIEAPFDGVVRSESVDRGQVVAPGQSIASIYASDAVEIVVPLTDDEAALLPELWERTPGEAEAREVPVVVIAEYGGREYAWHGFVDRAEGTLGAGTRTIDVVVRVPSPLAPRSIDPTLTTETTGVPDPRPPLLLDTYVNVEIEGVSLERYVTLPRVALREGPSVWVVRRDSILEMVPVRAIQETDDLAHLHAPPIEDGDRVVVSDLAAPTDGMRVRVATE
ncbi:MAG: HlyD family efflux transporter periplasmic adaptor subunit, partial [Gemmatimonadota bacterium]|nr:HlyD family efflux transporter periplasmic adaptor subunit [Gemmatimonadota bacterium]